VRAAGSETKPDAPAGPRWLLAELSYRCPLRCVYCSNPRDFAELKAELGTEDWLRVLKEARALGAVQLGLSGGEPLVRKDLVELVAEARRLGYYSNLITSGIGLSAGRLAALKDAGLDHVQLSLQAASAELNDAIGGASSFARKLAAAALIKDAGYPMVLNVVLHRLNIAQVAELLDLAERLGADYVELANAQYDGWAFNNRDALLPTRAQLAQAEAELARFRASPGKHPKVFWVVPDYYEGRPKPCGGGWARHMLVVAPDGSAMPCHGARQLPIAFPNVRTQSVGEIWSSPPFARFRGEEWMPDLCRTCPEKERDFGGCRCQAFLLTGDAAATDPACAKSSHHGLVADAVARSATGGAVLRYRDGVAFRAP
jgi:pyrroloquinoline quinone biosynthesis protein E